MPTPPVKSSKSTLTKIVTFVIIAVAFFLILRFVFSVAMGILRFLALGALVVFVLWLFLKKGDDDSS